MGLRSRSRWRSGNEDVRGKDLEKPEESSLKKGDNSGWHGAEGGSERTGKNGPKRGCHERK